MTPSDACENSANVIVLGRFPRLKKGAILISRSRLRRDNRPEIGVVLAVSGFGTPGNTERGYHVLFESGFYQFLREELLEEDVSELKGVRLDALRRFQFDGALRVYQLYHLGRFESVFEAARHEVSTHLHFF